jgi:hypothetical protein
MVCDLLLLLLPILLFTSSAQKIDLVQNFLQLQYRAVCVHL